MHFFSPFQRLNQRLIPVFPARVLGGRRGRLTYVLLKLEKMVHGGAALARLADGRVALVRGGLPGERVKAEVQERAGVLQGVVTEVVDASPHRITLAPGPTPGRLHPGLDYSHSSYSYQLELKRGVAEDARSRALSHSKHHYSKHHHSKHHPQASAVGSSVPISPVVAAPEPWGYRSAVQPAVSRTGLEAGTATALGYRQPQTDTFVPLEDDPIANAGLNRVWTRLQEEGLPKGVRELALRGNDVGEVLVCLIASASAKNYLDAAHRLLGDGIVGVSYAQYDPRGRFRRGSERLAGARSITQRYGDFDLTVSATSFAQPNPAAASQLYGELTRWAGAGAHALELYAGSGVISLHLAGGFEQVTALELDRSSVIRGERDAKRLGVDNLSFIHADARKLAALPEAELITVDPPRAGLAKAARQAITASKAARLIYVSCDVATWARDVAEFTAAGWRLERAQPFDFYPQTHHTEMLSLLTR